SRGAAGHQSLVSVPVRPLTARRGCRVPSTALWSRGSESWLYRARRARGYRRTGCSTGACANCRRAGSTERRTASARSTRGRGASRQLSPAGRSTPLSPRLLEPRVQAREDLSRGALIDLVAVGLRQVQCVDIAFGVVEEESGVGIAAAHRA